MYSPKEGPPVDDLLLPQGGTAQSKGVASIRPSVAWFSEQMERKLRRDDNCKCAWETEDVWCLLESAFDEWQELSQAIRDHVRHGAPAANVVAECADVANMVMMIACQMDAGMRGRRRGM